MMTGISGCGASGNHQDTSSSMTKSGVKASRKPEEAAVEGHFEPFFTFLEAEQKDFSRVERYSSSFDVAVLDKENDEYSTVENVRILFDNLSLSNEGIYLTKNSENSSSDVVKLDVQTGNIVQTNQNVKINHYIVPVITTEEIRENPVSNYLVKHPETELTSISYKVTPHLSFIKMMVDEYQIKDVKNTQLYLSKKGQNEYSFQVGVTSNDGSMYTLSLSLTLKH